MEENRIPMWLDCDPGYDDFMAIVLAAYNPRINLLGISTTYGNAPVESTTQNACRILHASGIDHVPLVKGADSAICHQENKRASRIHNPDGLSTKNNTKLPNTTKEPLNKNPYVFMAETILASKAKVHLVATGNLTNVAVLLKAFPEVKTNIEQVSFMGGAINYGNISPAAEANMFHDPDAADVVCHSGLKVIMVPLDVTHTVLVTDEVIKKIEAWNTPYSQLCVGILQFFAERYRSVYGFEHPPLHDPCAVAYCVAPELFTVKHCYTQIDRVSESCRGRTVCDMHGVLGRPKNVHVATKIDVLKFWELMLEALESANTKSRMD